MNFLHRPRYQWMQKNLAKKTDTFLHQKTADRNMYKEIVKNTIGEAANWMDFYTAFFDKCKRSQVVFEFLL